MIGRLSGIVVERGPDHVVLDVQGVGYVVHCSERTLLALPATGGAAALYTDLLVREDLLQLFGFVSRTEREWHRLLMSVQGVGAKASLAILGALGADGISRAIALGDQTAIRAAKGIGPKTALRVVNELRDKAPSVMAMAEEPGGAIPAPAIEAVEIPVPSPGGAAARAPSPGGGAGTAQSSALSALSNLGYAPAEAAAAVAEAAHADPEASEAGLIRAALRLLAPKG